MNDISLNKVDQGFDFIHLQLIGSSQLTTGWSDDLILNGGLMDNMKSSS